MKHFAEQFEFPQVIAVMQSLNKKYPVGSRVLLVDGYEYRIKSEWTKEAEVYGAWAKSEIKNSTIWITQPEVIDMDSIVIYES